jgi:uncharacterized YkwD family protein
MKRIKLMILATILLTVTSVSSHACETKKEAGNPKGVTASRSYEWREGGKSKFGSIWRRWHDLKIVKKEKKDTTVSPIPTLKPTLKPTQTTKPTRAPKVSPTHANATTTPVVVLTDNGISKDEQALLELVNDARKKAGLNTLSYDGALSKVAMEKAKDMVENQYFDHDSPKYGSPFDMMKSFGIKFGYAGENIAAGYGTPKSVFDGWMNSPGHKANILGKNFTHCGFGVMQGGNNSRKTWVQMFISK